MKKTLLFVFVLMSLVQLQAQTQFIDLEHSRDIQIHRDDFQVFELEFSFDKIQVNEVLTSQGEYNEIIIDGAYYAGEIGTPKLPAIQKIIEIPFGSKPVVKLISYSEQIIDLKEAGFNEPIVPVQASVRKDEDTENLPFVIDKTVYARDVFVSHDAVVDYRILGTLRGNRLAALGVYPVSYNPVLGIIKVLNEIRVEVRFESADAMLTQQIKERTHSQYFEVMNRMVLNKGVEQQFRNNSTANQVAPRYLIIADSMFAATLQPFILWKTQKGFDVLTKYTYELGNDSCIKAYISAVYNAATPQNPAPSFVLFVGDTPQVPASAEGQFSHRKTDLYYACIDNDYLPDIFYGRMSAVNTTQLENIINKTLYYEKYQFVNPSYLDNVTLIAGADNTWNPMVAQPTINYGLTNYFNAAHGYSNVFSYLSAPYTNAYQADRIAVGLINYTAHCSETSWGTPSLGISQVNAFQNEGMYPLAVANCCLSGDFGHNECIGEAWTRAANKGAVAYIGSSPNSYWYEDFYWSVGAHHYSGGVTPSVENSSTGVYDAMFGDEYVTAGSYLLCGNMAVTEADNQNYPTSVNPQYYWEAYNLLGDPSLSIYHTQGQENNVSHEAVFPVGANTFEVSAASGSTVSISQEGTLLGMATIESNENVVVNINPVYDVGQVDLVVSKPQYIPYMVTIPAAVLDGPYLMCSNVSINDDNGNAQVDYGENVSLNLSIKNVGIADVTGQVSLTISTSDAYVTCPNNAVVFNGLEMDSVIVLQNAFSIAVADMVPDGHEVVFIVHVSQGDDYWESNFKIKVHSPIIKIDESVVVLDNENNVLDLGETTFLGIAISNEGSSAAAPVVLNATSNDPLLQVEIMQYVIDTLFPKTTTVAQIQVTASNDANLGYPASMTFNVSSGEYNVTYETEIILGETPSYNMTNGITVRADYGYFYDMSGPDADYLSNRSDVMTFIPEDTTKLLQFSFMELELEPNYDLLYAYDDTLVNSEKLIGKYTGNQVPEKITATNAAGAITFHFVSDDNIIKSGWKSQFCVVSPNWNLGIAEQETNCITVFPNPAGEQLNILVENPTDDFSYCMFNSLGQVILEKDLGAFQGKHQLDLSGFPNGFYFLQLHTDTQTVVRKIIVNNR